MLLQGGGGWGKGGGVARWAAAQPSDTGGDTQPYFSWVFTRDLKVASASLRLKAFLDLPGFLHIRPCKAGKQTGETSEYNRRFQSERLPSGAAANQHLSTIYRTFSFAATSSKVLATNPNTAREFTKQGVKTGLLILTSFYSGSGEHFGGKVTKA